MWLRDHTTYHIRYFLACMDSSTTMYLKSIFLKITKWLTANVCPIQIRFLNQELPEAFQGLRAPMLSVWGFFWKHSFIRCSNRNMIIQTSKIFRNASLDSLVLYNFHGWDYSVQLDIIYYLVLFSKFLPPLASCNFINKTRHFYILGIQSNMPPTY